MTTPTRLSAQFRADQIDIAQDTARELIDVAGAFNLRAIDQSAPGWMAAVESIVLEQHDRSAALGARLYEDYRAASGVTAAAVAPSTPVLDREALRGALTIAGPYAAKHALSIGRDFDTTFRLILSFSVGAAIKATLAGGRNTVQETSLRDTRCVGYMRVTSGKPCAFCAMVAQNTYGSVTAAAESSGTRGRAASPQPPRSRYHSHCKCTVVPIFNTSSWPDGYRAQAAGYRDLWVETARDGGTDKEKQDRFFAAFYERYTTS